MRHFKGKNIKNSIDLSVRWHRHSTKRLHIKHTRRTCSYHIVPSLWHVHDDFILFLFHLGFIFVLLAVLFSCTRAISICCSIKRKMHSTMAWSREYMNKIGMLDIGI